MTGYDFSQHNSNTLMHIGTAGGWTKASTDLPLKNRIEKSILCWNT